MITADATRERGSWPRRLEARATELYRRALGRTGVTGEAERLTIEAGLAPGVAESAEKIANGAANRRWTPGRVAAMGGVALATTALAVTAAMIPRATYERAIQGSFAVAAETGSNYVGADVAAENVSCALPGPVTTGNISNVATFIAHHDRDANAASVEADMTSTNALTLQTDAIDASAGASVPDGYIMIDGATCALAQQAGLDPIPTQEG
ncbi:MAG TPA: hypothetical protein VMB52_04230 [Verrucomicrobiae bacterium]|nr:hypothetical protein [Verrucomicrobiae bacterium]